MTEAKGSALEILERSLIDYVRNNRELAKASSAIVRLEKELMSQQKIERFCVNQEAEINESINAALRFFDDDDEEARELLQKYISDLVVDNAIIIEEE